jgi:tetratricopeptide (TPR) repeat protein
MVNAEDNTVIAARRFLRTGRTTGCTPEELARICERMVRDETEQSSRQAIRLGRAFVERARPYGTAMLLPALRALSWAYLVGADYRKAAASYLAARRLARHRPLVRARIDRALIDVYMYLGRHNEASRRAARAMETFRQHGEDADLAKTQVNYANVLHRADRHREARDLYHRAGQFFAEHHDYVAAALCRYNEANTLVQLFELPEAERLYNESREVLKQHDHALRATGCLYGLAWLHMIEGRFHIALHELAECGRHYRQSGQEREYTLCLLDRAETYLGLNLRADAKKSAAEAERRARRLGIGYEAAKAAFFVGKALLGMNQVAAGHRALARAADGFTRQRHEGFLAVVQFHQVLAKDDGPSRSKSLAALRKQMSASHLPLWEALCDLELLRINPDSPAVRRRLAANRAAAAVPHIRAQHLTLQGDHDARHGRLKEATRHWTEAAQLLTAVRSKLPPVDMRSAFSESHRGPYERLIDITADQEPAVAAAWHDRYRTAGLWSGDKTGLDSRARGRAEESLALLADRVTALASRLLRDPGKRSLAVDQITAEQQRLEEYVRVDLGGVAGSQQPPEEQVELLVEDIARVSMSGPVVQFHAGQRDLIAFVHEDGRSRTHRFVDGVSTLDAIVRQWRFFVERAPYSATRARSDDSADEARLVERLSDWLWSPLEIQSGRTRLLVVPDGRAANLPWSALRVGGRHIIDSRPLVLAPSLQHHCAARRIRTRSRSVRVFVGSVEGLCHCRDEYDPLLNDNRHDVVVHDPTRRDDWPTGSKADIWHFTGHAQLRSDNPFYSSLQLSDGPIFAADFRLRANAVNLVVLAACRTGLHSLLPGEESTGLIRALLEMGARNVVASHWGVGDKSTAVWIDHFYRALLGGAGPADAAATATQLAREQCAAIHDWAAFGVFGAG